MKDPQTYFKTQFGKLMQHLSLLLMLTYESESVPFCGQGDGPLSFPRGWMDGRRGKTRVSVVNR